MSETSSSVPHSSASPEATSCTDHPSYCKCANLGGCTCGHSAHAEPLADASWLKITSRLSQLIFAARALAQTNLRDRWNISGTEPFQEQQPQGCRECGVNVFVGSRPHAATCRTGRVLGLIDQLCNPALQIISKKKEITREEDSPRAGAGTLLRGAFVFGEPWKKDEVASGEMLKTFGGRILAFRHICDGLATTHDFFRIVACVNYCAGISTRNLLSNTPELPVKGGE